MLLIIFGLLFILLAVFANMLGLTHSVRWGSSRLILLGLGLFLVGLVPLARLARRTIQRTPFLKRMAAGTVNDFRSIRHSTLLGVLVSLLVMLAIGVFATWYTSLGKFPTFRRDFNPYVDLGEAFLHGQLSLLEQPDPRLATIADPYNNIQARENIQYRFDLTYYKGKFYVYWGPVPALVYAAYQAVVGGRPPDQWGMLIFYIGLGLLFTWVLWQARRLWFPRAPGLSIALFTLAAMLSLPQLFLLARSNIYETAIMAGQCFIFLGLACWLAYLRTQRWFWLVLTGLAYALAVGSRYNLLLSVAVFAAMTLFHFWRTGRFSLNSFRQAGLFLTPLVIVAIMLGAYNVVRFGSPLQSGMDYQLPKHGESYKEYYAHMYSLDYVPSNIYSYVLYPPAYREDFPFIISQPLRPEQFPSWAKMPSTKDYEEVMFGGLFVLPVFWLVVLTPLLGGLALVQKSRGHAPSQAFPGLFVVMLILGGLAQAAYLLTFYFAAMRYFLDFSLLWMVALVLAIWYLDRQFAGLPPRSALALRLCLWVIITLVIFATVLVALLGGFDIPPQLLRTLNPSVFGILKTRTNNIYWTVNSMYQAIYNGPTILSTLLRLIIR